MANMRLRVLLVILAVFTPLLSIGAGSVAAQQTMAQETTAQQTMAQGIVVDAARIHDHGTHTRIVFDFSRLVQPDIFTLDGEAGRPHRVVIDLPEVTWSVEGGAQIDGAGVISQVRYARNRPGRSRVVLDMPGPATVQDVQLFQNVGEPAHLVLDLYPSDQESFTASSGFPDVPQVDAPAAEPLYDGIADVLASLGSQMEGPVSLPVAQQPEQQLPAEHLRPVIVIDPGHGGRDSGSVTINDDYEKTIALSIGLAMRDALIESGLFEVHMTRDDDTFIPLNERYAVAQDLMADLFISVHVDSNDSAHARGATIYTLSESASDDEAAEVANRENQSDRLAGYEIDEELTRILIDLAQRETMNLSAELATILVGSFEAMDLNTVSRPHRFAGFRVLMAPDVPSILLETGFGTNATDAELLVSEAYQQDLSLAMVETLVRYFDMGPQGELWLAQNAEPRN